MTHEGMRLFCLTLNKGNKLIERLLEKNTGIKVLSSPRLAVLYLKKLLKEDL